MIDTVFAPLKAASETLQKLVETRDAIKVGEIKAVLLAQISTAYETTFAIQAALREENEALNAASWNAIHCKHAKPVTS